MLPVQRFKFKEVSVHKALAYLTWKMLSAHTLKHILVSYFSDANAHKRGGLEIRIDGLNEWLKKKGKNILCQ